MRAVNHKAFGVSLHNRYSTFAEFNRETKMAGSAVCDDNDDSTEQEIVVHVE